MYTFHYQSITKRLLEILGYFLEQNIGRTENLMYCANLCDERRSTDLNPKPKRLVWLNFSFTVANLLVLIRPELDYWSHNLVVQ